MLLDSNPAGSYKNVQFVRRSPSLHITPSISVDHIIHNWNRLRVRGQMPAFFMPLPSLLCFAANLVRRHADFWLFDSHHEPLCSWGFLDIPCLSVSPYAHSLHCQLPVQFRSHFDWIFCEEWTSDDAQNSFLFPWTCAVSEWPPSRKTCCTDKHNEDHHIVDCSPKGELLTFRSTRPIMLLMSVTNSCSRHTCSPRLSK